MEVGQSGQIDDTFGNGPKGTPRWFGSAAWCKEQATGLGFWHFTRLERPVMEPNLMSDNEQISFEYYSRWLLVFQMDTSSKH